MDPIFSFLVLVRWLHFGAMFALFGCATVPIWLFRDTNNDTSAAQRIGLLCIRCAAPLALLSGLGWVVGTFANVTGDLEGLADPDTLRAFFLETAFGPVEVARLAGLLVVTALAFAPMRQRHREVAIAIGSGALLVSQAWLGHAAEGGDSWRGAAMIACYGTHVLAAAAWAGSLPPLLAYVVSGRRNPAAMLPLLSRYSFLASVAVGLIVASGVANTMFRVGTKVGALLASGYGAVLGLKLALVVLMLALAAFNRFVEMPRLGSGAATRLGASIACEIVLGLLVLAAAAVLGITPPPAV